MYIIQMKIYVKTMDNKYEFTINENHTITEFKQQIYEYLEIDPSQQRLIYKGSPMIHEKTFKDLHVEENTTIHLLLNII